MTQVTIERRELGSTRYNQSGDDYVFVEIDEAMSFDANFKAQAITKEVENRDLNGILELAAGNASYLIHVDPTILRPDELIEELREIEEEIDLSEFTWESKVVDIPVLFNDPWTHETVMDFRDRHQDPDATDLEYSARINGFDSVEEFIEAFVRAPYLACMVGFVPGTTWMFQMVPYDEQIVVPKYKQPRTSTPSRAVSVGGSFAGIYPVRGAGGFQLYGRTPVEVLDINQKLAEFERSIVLLKAGDILKFRRIEREEYDKIRQAVEDGSYEYTKTTFDFEPEKFFTDPKRYNEKITEALYR